MRKDHKPQVIGTYLPPTVLLNLIVNIILSRSLKVGRKVNFVFKKRIEHSGKSINYKD